MTSEEKEFRRLNYCGTCKTIGSLYTQKARLLLNHDTVFLAEILSALGGEQVSEWQKSYRSFNCLSLPQSAMPASLQFAATTNVILAEFKLADHVADERGRRRYKMARTAFSAEFQKAEKLLESWDFPLREIKEILQSQTAREASAESLDEMAFPTAETTGVFFREGVRRVGRPELAGAAFETGFAFGKLVYLIDAYEDYEKDFRGAQFNAFRRAFRLNEARLAPESKRRITAILRESESEVRAKIDRLPLDENRKKLFVARLSQNLEAKLKTGLPVLKSQTACAVKQRRTFRERWLAALEKARNLTRGGGYGWQMPLVFLFVLAFALAAPAQTREAKSARECFDLGFNLMALGAVFGAVLAFPKTLLMQNPPPGEQPGKKKSDWCDCGSWDCQGCDGCCDGCCCCCENCNCDGCCCDCSCD